MTPQHEMPALVAHILHDLEANYGFIDLMAGSGHASLRLRSDWDGEERLFEVSPRDEGLTLLPPVLDTPDRYWHVLTLDLFGEPDARTGDQPLYAQLTAGVGFTLEGGASVSVVFEVSDGDGDGARMWDAPFLYGELAWRNWAASEWPRVEAYADALVQLEAFINDEAPSAALAA